MKANLARIPGEKDYLAEKILQQIGGDVDQRFLDSLAKDACLALGRYGVRMASIALRNESPSQLEKALMAVGLSSSRRDDPRDVMISLSLHHAVAKMIGIRPGVLFSKVSDRLPEGVAANTIRQFGDREDVTLAAFGWTLVDTPEGPDFCPS